MFNPERGCRGSAKCIPPFSMIECVNGEGQGVCRICFLEKGFHREWSSSLYYIKNPNGLYLRYHDCWGAHFSSNIELPKLVFCYKHALIVNDIRKTLVDWGRGN